MKSFLQYTVEGNLGRNLGILGGAALAGALALNPDKPVVDNTTQLPPQQGTVLQAQTDIPEDQKPKEEKPDPLAHFGGAHNAKLYKAIMAAEYRGRDIGDPFAFNEKTMARTGQIPPPTKNKKTGKMQQLTSSAYGPLQITVGTASAFRQKKPELFADVDPKYMDAFETQGRAMIKAGNVKGGKYGLNGCGDLCDPKHLQNYERMGVGVIRGKLQELGIDDTKELSPKDLEKFARSWAAEHYSQEYMDALRSGYN